MRERRERSSSGRNKLALRVGAFYAWRADHAYLPELVTLAKTVQERQSEIEAFLLTGITNAKQGNQSCHHARSPLRLRLPQPGQPAPPITLRNHPRKQKSSHPRLIAKTPNDEKGLSRAREE
ncbi:hypothetical protein [Nonomuraea diastatica]|uniref:hypothetical protein n=1 Tax=Nonomuraea diastatica TaxID=1848329 RepID=UPI0015F2B2DB|nr:hypothetical protein [Nonomuraea diastatica]